MNIPKLNAGEVWAGISLDGEPHHVILLPATPDNGLKWQEASDWAKSVGGELPTRFESALLYANARNSINTSDWYWTTTQPVGYERYAWAQTFTSGYQTSLIKGIPSRARAVRRVLMGD